MGLRKEEKVNDKTSAAARWLTALAVVFVPLSIIILISGSWLANFTSNQWTRHLLFASWISLTLSVILGVVNMVGQPEGRASLSEERMDDKGCGEKARDQGAEGSEAAPDFPPFSGKTYTMEQILLLIQATTFILGLFLYVAFISWMVLPKINLTGF